MADKLAAIGQNVNGIIHFNADNTPMICDTLLDNDAAASCSPCGVFSSSGKAMYHLAQLIDNHECYPLCLYFYLYL